MRGHRGEGSNGKYAWKTPVVRSTSKRTWRRCVEYRDAFDFEHKAFEPHRLQRDVGRRAGGIGETARADRQVFVQRLGRTVAQIEALAHHEVVHRRAEPVEDTADELHRDARLRSSVAGVLRLA